jgi:hypothetical protein
VQGTTVIGMFLVILEPDKFAIKLLVVVQFAALTEDLLTFVAATIILGVAS